MVRLSKRVSGVCKFEKYCCKAQWSLNVIIDLTHGNCVYHTAVYFILYGSNTKQPRFLATVLSGLSLQWRRTMFSES